MRLNNNSRKLIDNKLSATYQLASKEFRGNSFVNSYNLAVKGLSELVSIKDKRISHKWRHKFKELMSKSVKNNLVKLGF